ncbi:MAG: AMP-dependent synthetase/ligase [Pseudomonadota bacterium]
MTYATITPDEAVTIPGLFHERVIRTPHKVAYRQYDEAAQCWRSYTWQQVSNEVGRWQAAVRGEGMEPGDRVALMLRNGLSWVVFDQAMLGLGLVTVPLYVEDRAENVAYIINDAQVKLLVLQDITQWQALAQCADQLRGLTRVVLLEAPAPEQAAADPRLISLSDWLFGAKGEAHVAELDPKGLATIIYTSGTTGRPKGVMLSHRNLLVNAYAGLCTAPVGAEDVFLSFLPLSHALERTAGYLLPMMLGAEVAYARSIPLLGEDLLSVCPTVLISVPRIYERVYHKIQAGLEEKSPMARRLFALAVEIGWQRFEYQQRRSGWKPGFLLWPLLEKAVASKVLAKLGGRLKLAICGGAALSPDVAKLFIGLGLPLIQGYGLTEASPVVAVNRIDNNIPASIGPALPKIEVRIGEGDELQTRSECVMLGYWSNPQATRDTMTADGWLRTGDKARIDDSGHIYITGRLKDIIVLANGEKVPPADMEMAIGLEPLFEQVMVLGEGKPYLSALIVVNADEWRALAGSLGLDPEDAASLRDPKAIEAVQARLDRAIAAFPGYARIRQIALYREPWTIENGILTPTLKIKRAEVSRRFADDIARLYEGH